MCFLWVSSSRNRSRSHRSTLDEKGELLLLLLFSAIHRVSIYRFSILYLIVCVYIFQDAGSQQIGFLLGSCGISVALTSEACLKGLPKVTTGEVVAFKGWPKLQWFVTEHLAKTPKDWLPPPKLTDDTPAYIEVNFDFSRRKFSVVVTINVLLFVYSTRRIKMVLLWV